MTVGAVSSISYSSVIQYRYFDTTISDAQIKDLMAKYGITPSGNQDKDLKALYDAMYTDAQSSATSALNNANQTQNNPEVTGKSASNAPWANLMTQIGLVATGDFDVDYQAFSNKIFEMKMSATTPQDKAMISQLVSQAEIVFVPPTTAFTQNPGAPKSASGADILAQLNKMYFFS